MRSGAIVPRVKATVVWAELDGEVVLYDENSGFMHLLNPQAAAIWERVDGVVSVDQITRDLSEAYQADEKEMAEDVADFMDKLIAKGVLEDLSIALTESD